MAKVGRPLFRRRYTYVAVRRIRMTATSFIEPGERVNLPTYRLRSLYNRRRIGPEGHPWTEQALQHASGYPLGYVTDAKSQEAEKPADQTENIEPVKVGSYWLIPGITDQKFRSRKKARAFLDDRKGQSTPAEEPVPSQDADAAESEDENPAEPPGTDEESDDAQRSES